MDAATIKAVLDHTTDPKAPPSEWAIKPFCERCGREIKDMSKAVKVTVNCDTFEVFLGHDVDTGYPNKRVIGNTLLGSDCARAIGLTERPRKRGNVDA